MNTEQTINLSLFAENPDNPSVASDDAIARLMKKLRKVPDGLKASRIAYVTDYVTRQGVSMAQWLVVLSGNKRLRVLKEIYGESAEVPADWFQDVTGLTPPQRREFIINMNITDGEWIASRLMSLYTKDELRELMSKDELDAILAELPRPQSIDENEEIEPASFAPEMTLKFTLTRAEHDRAQAVLAALDPKPAVALMKLIGGSNE